jgi:hypothetical protein
MKVKTSYSKSNVITAGKEYTVIDPQVKRSVPFCGWIISDDGVKCFIMLDGISNLIGGNVWEIISEGIDV